MRAAPTLAALLLAAGLSAPAAGAAPGVFDFYLLALSWSPSFCATGGDARAPAQCAANSGLGFAVHGLWPQFARGFPSDCAGAERSPSRQAVASADGLYPDEGLARHEWRVHGTCSGLSPTDYYALARRARAAVTIPEPFRAPRAAQTWAPLDVARTFAASNPGLGVDEMAVTCRSGDLEEVRICFNKDLSGFVPCPQVARASCRAPGMAVPPPR